MTDRYAKAIEQLGNEKLDVRLGGIYALDQLAALLGVEVLYTECDYWDNGGDYPSSFSELKRWEEIMGRSIWHEDASAYHDPVEDKWYGESGWEMTPEEVEENRLFKERGE